MPSAKSCPPCLTTSQYWSKGSNGRQQISPEEVPAHDVPNVMRRRELPPEEHDRCLKSETNGAMSFDNEVETTTSKNQSPTLSPEDSLYSLSTAGTRSFDTLGSDEYPAALSPPGSSHILTTLPVPTTLPVYQSAMSSVRVATRTAIPSVPGIREPINLRLFGTDDVVQCVARRYEARARACVVKSTELDNPSCYHSICAPSISLEIYLKRMKSMCRITDESFVLGLIYADRLIARKPHLVVNSLTVHRIALICTVIAAKFFEDIFYSNSCYARSGGVSLKEMNSLEMFTLCDLDFQLYVSTKSYAHYVQQCAVLSGLLPRKLQSLGPIVR